MKKTYARRFVFCMYIAIICLITTPLGSSTSAFTASNGRIQTAPAEDTEKTPPTLSTPEEPSSEPSSLPGSSEEPSSESSPLPSASAQPSSNPSSLPSTPDAGTSKESSSPDALSTENSDTAVPSVSEATITSWEWVGNPNDVPYWFHDRWELALSLTSEYLWGTMDFLWDVRMTIFLGVVRESLTMTSTFIRHTVN